MTVDRTTDVLPGLDALTALPGVQEVELSGHRLRVTLPEADVVIGLFDSPSGHGCETAWEVTAREAPPGLSTWWIGWHRSFAARRSEVAPLLAAELQDALGRVRRMLDDHARA